MKREEDERLKEIQDKCRSERGTHELPLQLRSSYPSEKQTWYLYFGWLYLLDFIPAGRSVQSKSPSFFSMDTCW